MKFLDRPLDLDRDPPLHRQLSESSWPSLVGGEKDDVDHRGRARALDVDAIVPRLPLRQLAQKAHRLRREAVPDRDLAEEHVSTSCARPRAPPAAWSGPGTLRGSSTHVVLGGALHAVALRGATSTSISARTPPWLKTPRGLRQQPAQPTAARARARRPSRRRCLCAVGLEPQPATPSPSAQLQQPICAGLSTLLQPAFCCQHDEITRGN